MAVLGHPQPRIIVAHTILARGSRGAKVTACHEHAGDSTGKVAPTFLKRLLRPKFREFLGSADVLPQVVLHPVDGRHLSVEAQK